ncbi:uncharacterized protein FTOL_03645 [Fusarium torulosum]|uniref:Uncharacterized protein n=1 Tax=Fusarium torulosum TaxID=33205 RepID=A0AAE8M4C2_9HYPO|nr:uncharacterized protein FTOL_03645 [Fusarium torulosum]
MDRLVPAEAGRKKRGRPRQYATAQDKTDANVKQRRAKRQKEISEQRNKQHADFYDVGLPSVLPPIPNQVSGVMGFQSGGRPESVTIMPETHSHILEPDNLDFLHLLPPPTPPLEPMIPEEMPPYVGETLEAASPFPGPLGDDMEDIDSIAIADDAEASSHTDTVHKGRVERLGRQLVDQLIRFRGCCMDCHRSAKVQHDQDSREHISLATYMETTEGLCPDVLGSARIATPDDDLSREISTSSRRQIYCGVRSGDQAPHICLTQDEQITHVAKVQFDVDSVTGFPNSLAVAKQGIRWFPTQMPVSDLQSDLHLCKRQVQYFDATGFERQVKRPVHQIPHYTLGRLIGFQDVSLYLLSPHLYREEQQSSRLRDEDFRTWMDGVLLPVIYSHYSSSHAQHYPSSYDHSRCNATARSVETLAQRVHPVSREQLLMYYLPPESLEAVWISLRGKVQQSGFRHFRDVTILLQAKNLEVLTKDITWAQMMARFQSYWVNAVDEKYVTADFYIDIGKETYPQQVSQAVSYVAGGTDDSGTDSLASARAGSLLYKRCCLQSYGYLAESGPTGEEAQKQVFYPILAYWRIVLTIQWLYHSKKKYANEMTTYQPFRSDLAG